MKNIFLLFVLCSVLCSCPTEAGEERVYTYSIVNNTDYVVEVIPYQNPGNGLPELSKKIVIQPGGKFERITTDSPPYSSGASFQRALYDGYLQKLDIVFNNSRKVTYEVCTTSNCDPKNIFHFSHNNDNTEVYNINQEDYQNATDCGGNCY